MIILTSSRINGLGLDTGHTVAAAVAVVTACSLAWSVKSLCHHLLWVPHLRFHGYKPPKTAVNVHTQPAHVYG